MPLARHMAVPVPGGHWSRYVSGPWPQKLAAPAHHTRISQHRELATQRLLNHARVFVFVFEFGQGALKKKSDGPLRIFD
jgi:hypothetical protein